MEVTGFKVLVAVFALVIVGLLVAAASSTDATRRAELFAAAAAGVGALLLVLLVGATVMGQRPLGETRRLTMRELRMLADDAVKAQEVERAVQHLRAIQSRLQDENAYRKVEEEIQRLERGVAR